MMMSASLEQRAKTRIQSKINERTKQETFNSLRYYTTKRSLCRKIQKAYDDERADRLIQKSLKHWRALYVQRSELLPTLDKFYNQNILKKTFAQFKEIISKKIQSR